MQLVDEHDWVNFPELRNDELDELLLVSPHFQIVMDFEALVVRVHDGDTVTLRIEERDFDFPLRFLSIDAPELSTGAQGEEAREFLKGLVEGREVYVKVDPLNRVEKFGRLLGDLIVDGLNVGETMVQLGYAFPFERRREGEIEDFDVSLEGSQIGT